jgi:hypothetical protein
MSVPTLIFLHLRHRFQQQRRQCRWWEDLETKVAPFQNLIVLAFIFRSYACESSSNITLKTATCCMCALCLNLNPDGNYVADLSSEYT